MEFLLIWMMNLMYQTLHVILACRGAVDLGIIISSLLSMWFWSTTSCILWVTLREKLIAEA